MFDLQKVSLLFRKGDFFKYLRCRNLRVLTPKREAASIAVNRVSHTGVIEGRGFIMKYGYARVSGVGQDYEIQLKQLKDAGCEVIFNEKVTGMNADRKEFKKLLAQIETGDTLIVTKLDRFARSADDGVKIIKELLAKGINVHILNMGLVEDTPMGRLILRMLSAIAEFDRDMIVERMAEGKAIARLEPDYREGRRPTYSKKQIDHALGLLESQTYRQVVERTGISKSTLIRAKRERQI